jgi:hypothetical protein
VAVVQDALSAASIPGGALLGAAVEQLIRKRGVAAGEILISELRRGDRTLSEIEIDEFAAVLFRYMRAAQEGTARLNLRLMAKVVAGQASHSNLVADEFLYYTDILSSLRREEVILLGTMHRETTLQKENIQVAEEDKAGEAMTATRKQLVPMPFATEGDFLATAGALLRTGLISAVSGWGSLIYQTTPLLERFCALASIDDALNEENAGPQR